MIEPKPNLLLVVVNSVWGPSGSPITSKSLPPRNVSFEHWIAKGCPIPSSYNFEKILGEHWVTVEKWYSSNLIKQLIADPISPEKRRTISIQSHSQHFSVKKTGMLNFVSLILTKRQSLKKLTIWQTYTLHLTWPKLSFNNTSIALVSQGLEIVFDILAKFVDLLNVITCN